MERAKVICHMYVTIDGKIVTDLKGYPDCEIAGNIYDEITFSTSNAWGCGSKTFAYLSNSTVQLDLYEPKQGPLEDHFVKDDVIVLPLIEKENYILIKFIMIMEIKKVDLSMF